VRDAFARRALEGAKRIPWPQLEEKADAYTEWQVLALWVRAAVDNVGRIPAVVSTELDRRAPAVLSALSAKVNRALHRGEGPGAAAWEAVVCWTDLNLFLQARHEGWLDAVRYFSAASFRCMKAWSYWESVDASSRRSRPAAAPAFDEWEQEVAAVARVSVISESPTQRALDAIQSLRKADWDALLTQFIHLHALSVWMGLVLDGCKVGPRCVARELRGRYPGFSVADCGAEPKELLECFDGWALDHQIPGAKPPEVLEALRFCARRRAECVAVCHYAQSCRTSSNKPFTLDAPTFEEWKKSADAYFEPQ
jgi:hypothetical protein